MTAQEKKAHDSTRLLEKCLAAFVQAGTIDLSLDQLAEIVGISKRMLIHYFGGRDEIENRSMTLLEDGLRKQFVPEAFAPSASLAVVVEALWKRTTAAESRGVLLLVMDLSRRAWMGSPRAKAFYAEQQKLWVRLLMRFHPNRLVVEELLQLFQGALLAFLITGDPEPGRRSLIRFLSKKKGAGASAKR
jgi:AcrR family transcriptional regulator